MSEYLVTLKLSRRELIDFLDATGRIDNANISVIREAESAELAVEAPPPKRRKTDEKSDDGSIYKPQRAAKRRVSKINETILNAIANGEADATSLRKALVAAGLSEHSLSTGLAALQKAGKIRREVEREVPYGEGEGTPRGSFYTLAA